MITRREISPRLLVVLATSGLLTIVACGPSDGLEKRYSVSGTVTYKGEPLPKGDIGFVPDDPAARAASGTIENGSYTLSTLGDRDGALPGKYKVTIFSKDIDEAKATDLFKSKVEAKGKGIATVPKEFRAKMAKATKSNIPTRYNSPETSGFTAEVPAHSASFIFELTD